MCRMPRSDILHFHFIHLFIYLSKLGTTIEQRKALAHEFKSKYKNIEVTAEWMNTCCDIRMSESGSEWSKELVNFARFQIRFLSFSREKGYADTHAHVHIHQLNSHRSWCFFIKSELAATDLKLLHALVQNI